MGSLYFNHAKPVKLDDLVPEFEKILFRDSYELIWSTLTQAEKELVRIIVTTESGKVLDIKAKMSKPSGYSSLRARLENKHVINTKTRGYVAINLPRFREFVIKWHEDE